MQRAEARREPRRSERGKNGGSEGYSAEQRRQRASDGGAGGRESKNARGRGPGSAGEKVDGQWVFQCLRHSGSVTANAPSASRSCLRAPE
jgi:hypothetical protein